METETKIKIATDIIRKAVEINSVTQHDVFIRYSPHVDWLEVCIHKNGWDGESNGNTYIVDFSMNTAVDAYTDILTILDKLLYKVI
jgi:hypothetical protein